MQHLQYALIDEMCSQFGCHTDSSDDKTDGFYNTLESALSQIPKKDVKLITGDWNAKVGSKNEGQESVTGRYGYHTIGFAEPKIN